MIVYIQQLRVVAMILVLLYHIGLPVYGGFLGVDIFLFVSGFIIQHVLETKYKLDSLNNLAHFLANRFWRIFPLTLATILFTNVLALLFLSLKETKLILNDSIFSLTGISNIHYYLKSSIYGTSDSHGNPILHFWSISLEMQYYILFSLIAFISYRFNIRIHFLTLALFFASLSSVLFVTLPIGTQVLQNPEMAKFYLLPFRLFEFLAGAIVWRVCKRNASLSKEFKKSLLDSLLIGMCVLIVFSVKLDNSQLFFFRFVLIGLISVLTIRRYQIEQTNISSSIARLGDFTFSIYCLHLPCIVLAHLYFPQAKLAPVVSGFLSIPIAILFKKMVEDPLRFQSKPRKRFFSIVCILSAFLTTLIGVFNGNETIASEPFDNRNAISASKLDCEPQFEGSLICRINTEKSLAPLKVFVVGDSQALAAGAAILSSQVDFPIQMKIISRPGCPFLAPITRKLDLPYCRSNYKQDVSEIKKFSPDVLVIANQVASRLKGTSGYFAYSKRDCLRIIDEYCRLYQKSLKETISEFSLDKITIIVQNSIPEFIYLKRSPLNLNPLIDSNRDLITINLIPSRNVEYLVSKQFKNVFIVDPLLGLCRANSCSLDFNGVILYSNFNHVTSFGATRFSKGYKSILDRLNSQQVD